MLQGNLFPTEAQHVSWVPSSSARGTGKVWRVVASRIYSGSSIKYFPAFMKKRRTCLGLWRKYSRCQHVVGNGGISNSVWCRRSIPLPAGIWWSSIKMVFRAAILVSLTNTTTAEFLSCLKHIACSVLLLGACLAECWFLSVLLYLTNPCTACKWFCPHEF